MELREKTKEVFLLIEILLAVLWHIGHPLYTQYVIDQRKRNAKITFNALVDSNNTTLDVLKCLRILINNYESLDNVKILECRDLTILSNACDSLIPKQQKIFLFYSTTMNLCTLGAVLLPGLSFVLRKLLGRRQNANKLRNLSPLS